MKRKNQNHQTLRHIHMAVPNQQQKELAIQKKNTHTIKWHILKYMAKMCQTKVLSVFLSHPSSLICVCVCL